jgi:cellulose synthase/poly-beta-1,6-N-acetylglucosamine synthase-like glycosyltransferase
MIVAVLFCTFVFLGVYPYLLYPLFVNRLARFAGRPWRKGAEKPRVSLVISVFNEEEIIRKKLENALALHYPVGLLEILVVSDGSTDRTNEIVASFSDPRILLYDFPDRAGKTVCLNRTVPKTRGEVVLFTDANSMFPAKMLESVVRNFADRQVGLVTGWTKYRNEDGEEESAGLYARLERVTKEAEGLIASCVGADGAVFALRKELYHPLQDGDINDFVIPLKVVGQGKRVVLDPEVYCFEKPSEGEGKEFRRQVRITNRTLGAIMKNRRFLNPFIYGWFAFFLFSHKLLRFFVPFSFLATFFTALCLSGQSFFFAGIVLMQVLFIGFGIAALHNGGGGRMGQLCSFFLLTTTAQFVGWVRWASGKSDIMWTPQR